MRELSLRRTWFEISEYWHSSRNPLRVIEIVNALPPRSWTFRLTFDGAYNILGIECDPPIDVSEAVKLIDGSVEELLFANRVLVKCEGGHYVGATADLVESAPQVNVVCLNESDSDIDSLLVLHGYWYSSFLPREMQNHELVRNFVLENTWLGSKDYDGDGALQNNLEDASR